LYLAAAALLWCIAAGFLLYFLPLASFEAGSSSGKVVTGSERIFTASFSSLWPLILPALLCALATWSAARHHRWPLITVMSLLAVFTFLTGFSIGLFYVPAVVLLVVSVIVVGAFDGSSRGESSVAGKS
jgi:hypothetical protein